MFACEMYTSTWHLHVSILMSAPASELSQLRRELGSIFGRVSRASFMTLTLYLNPSPSPSPSPNPNRKT